MSLNRVVVAEVVIEHRSKAEVAEAYGLSRRWVHELVRRYETDGEAGLEPARGVPRPARIGPTLHSKNASSSSENV